MTESAISTPILSERRPPLGALPKTMIIVDDDRDIRETLAEILIDEGYRVRVADDGLQLVTAIGIERPDLILLDVMMSWVGGFDLCRSLKRNESLRDVPVVFLSAKTRSEDITRGLACGAVDYFTKPVDLERLLCRVRQLVSTP